MNRSTIRLTTLGTFVLALALLAAPALLAGEAAAVDGAAHQAFENLKDLGGTWNAVGPEGSDADADHGVHVFQVSANGTVVMETMFPGTTHEMINMYHMDGDDLVMTHYCAGGNQPEMKMTTESSASDMTFEFTGGANIDPGEDDHIHRGRVVVKESGEVESSWYSYSGGELAGEMVQTLRRAEG